MLQNRFPAPRTFNEVGRSLGPVFSPTSSGRLGNKKARGSIFSRLQRLGHRLEIIHHHAVQQRAQRHGHGRLVPLANLEGGPKGVGTIAAGGCPGLETGFRLSRGSFANCFQLGGRQGSLRLS